MRIGIIGIGALGCLFGARLTAVADVIMIGHWLEQLAALHDSLIVIDLDGSVTTANVTATDAPETVAPVDVVLVLVKSYQTEAVIGRIRPLLHDNTLIITLQNGLGNDDILAAAFGDNRVTIGTTSVGATVLRPGVVRHAGDGSIVLADDGGLIRPITPFAALLHTAGFAVDIVANARFLVWGKLAINAAINPLTALLRVRNGFLATHPDTCAIMQAAAAEVAAVATTQGIELPFASVGASAVQVAIATATNRSSMLQDIERGARTEIDAICGAVVRAGAIFGVATPINAQFLALVHAVEQGVPINQWNIEVGNSIINLQMIDETRRS